jgi:hypothetical protein
MNFITVTRPDGSKIVINVANILSIVEAPPQSSPMAGPVGANTRIVYSNKTHQDVIESVQQVMDMFIPRG